MNSYMVPFGCTFASLHKSICYMYVYT
uniref:Uncharacterized protein n=1 Tax=Tetranychus urticae TaxID=32264 RepID=T1KE23_TETUR